MTNPATALPRQVRRFPQHFPSDTDPSDLPLGGEAVWGERCCGLACLRTVLDFHDLPVPEQAPMLRRGLETGAYSDRGWIHAGLVDLALSYGLAGTLGRVPGIEGLEALVTAGVIPIVSCTFRFPENGRRGGHLVVFTGLADVDGHARACFADPSRWGGEHVSVPSSRFWASCTGNVIALWRPGFPPPPTVLSSLRRGRQP